MASMRLAISGQSITPDKNIDGERASVSSILWKVTLML